MSKEKVNKSKYLSWVLRHGLHDLNLIPDAEGFVNVLDIINQSNSPCKTISEILDIVETCPKKRFTIKKIDRQIFIRANQGHSQSIGNMIDTEYLMQKIEKPIPHVYHGSYQKHLPSIQLNGLNRMNRKHIHLTHSFNSISGKRYDSDLVVYVNMEKAMNDGIVFYESSNGVILTEGLNGILPTKYLSFTLLEKKTE
jgi:2'-phosphotransferase